MMKKVTVKKIIRVISVIIRRYVLKIRNFYYHQLFDVGENTTFFGKVLYYNPQLIKIGNNCSINQGVFFNAGTRITIGNNVSLSAGVFITSVTADMNAFPKLVHDYKEVIIGDGTWIAANAIILPGVKIGKCSIVGSGAVVHNNVGDGMIVVGNPGRVVSKINMRRV